MDPLVVGHGVVIPANELEWTAMRASGPGGQHVNKVSSAVDLRFDLQGSDALSPEQKSRVRTRLANRIDADGRVMVTSQATRDQSRNLEDARARLAELILPCLVKPKPRRPTKPTKGSQRRRLEDKRRQSTKKDNRRGRGDD